MKKSLLLALSGLLSFSLIACSSSAPAGEGEGQGEGTGEEGEEESFDVNAVDVSTLKLANTKEYTYNDGSEIASMDYVTTALATDHEINVNFVDGLIETNSFGNYVGSLAESWEHNDDNTVWTFHLRDGVKWVTNQGEEYADVTAEDFVTGLRHAAEFQTGTGYVAANVVGFTDYMNNGDFSDDAWAKVGVKALDEKTVEYTLNENVPYFHTMVEYTTFYPINKQFLESKGEGCKVGAPDVTNCSFGQPVPDSILYNGAYILDSFDVKSSTVLKKNNAYWDAANTEVEKVTIIYDEGQDPYATIRGFEQNIYAAAGLSTAWGDEVFNAMAKKYDGYVTTSLPNYYAFGVVFNYNRVTYDNTNYATDEALKENTKAAIRNENFRLALKSAFDVPKYLMATSPEDVAMGTLRNMNGVPNLVSTSDGTPYVQLVEKAYAEMTGDEKDLDDGQWPWLSKEKALEYLAAAEEEGIQFPVHLDMLVIQESDRLVKQAQSMKQSIEENTDGKIIIELVMRDTDTVQNIAYYSESWNEADYDISTFTGWGPDYVDPKTFTEIYSPVDGYYMHACGLTDKGVTASAEYGEDDDIKEALGFNEYEKLYREADAIKDDLDARYAAFAKADAYLLAHGLYIPTSMQSRAARVTHVVPFSASYSSGVSQYKLKGIRLQEEMVTKAQFEEAQAKFNAGE